MKHLKASREDRRLDRQFELLEQRFPRYAPFVRQVRDRRMVLIRLPLALLLITGGFLAILPVFGLWMIPVGLLLLAIDIPILKAPIANSIVRGRRRFEEWRRHR